MVSKLIPHQHIDGRFVFRLSLFLGIAVIMLGIVTYDVIKEDLSWWLALAGLIGGLIVGYILGRILTVKWHEGKQKAVMEMDIVGFIAIAVYIGLRIAENYIFGEFLSGAALSTLSLAVLAGILFGRFLGLRISVEKLIRANVDAS